LQRVKDFFDAIGHRGQCFIKMQPGYCKRSLGGLV
jgi:hypothetical protein